MINSYFFNHTKSHKAHNVKLCIKMLIQATKDTNLRNLVSMAIQGTQVPV